MIRLIYLILLMFTGPGLAAVLTQMRPAVQSDRVQITLETDSVPQFKHFGLDNPPRVVVDLMDSRSSSGNLAVGQGEVIGVRAGQSGPRTLRLVVDLKNPVPVKVAEQGGKIVIEVFNRDAKGDRKPSPSPTASRSSAGAGAGASSAGVDSASGSGSLGGPAPSPTIDYYQPQSFPTPTPYQGKTTYYSALAATPTPTAGSYGGLGGGYPGTSPGAAPYAATAGSSYGSSYLSGSSGSDGGGSSFFKNTRAALANGGGGSKPVELDKWGRPKPSGTPTSDSYNQLYGVQVSGEAPPIDTEERPREIPVETSSYASRGSSYGAGYGSGYGSSGSNSGYGRPVQLQGFPNGGGSADPKPKGAALATALPNPTPTPATVPVEMATSAFGAIQRPTAGGARTGPARNRRQEQSRSDHSQAVVVIDPGHGGKDPGAVSAETGIREKDVALAIGQRLRQNLQGRYQVVMTRDSDIYIPLKERVELARRRKADLFISIHADAASSQSSGSSVYILSLNGASSQLGRQLEKSENTVDMKWGNEGKRYDDELQAMLLNIQQEGTLESSQLLAEKVLAALGQVNNLSRREVEMANFVVLRAPEVPSILVETAFISNPSEAQLLATPDYQQRLADSLARGIDQFFREHLPQHLMLKK